MAQKYLEFFSSCRKNVCNNFNYQVPFTVIEHQSNAIKFYGFFVKPPFCTEIALH